MAKGRVEAFSYFDFADRDSGARVRRLTPPEFSCLRNYFYQKAFTSDGSRLIFGSDLDGRMNIWLLELGNGRAVQLTEGEGNAIQSAYLSRDDRFVFFNRGGSRHVRLDLETLEEEAVYEVPDGWLGYGTWVANDSCTRAAGIEMWAAHRVADSGGWERFARQFEARPRMRLLDVDLATGEARTVLDERRFIGHPMFRPGHDELMCFCHEGPHDLVDSRIWLVGRDGTDLRAAKAQAPGESCTHEFWVPDGSRLMYVSYVRGEARRSIRAFDPDTGVDEKIMAIPPCAHLMSDGDGGLALGDGAGQLGDVADKDGHALSPDPYIYLFDTRERSSRVVCRHDTSWAVHDGNTQASHPHPSFSPDGEKALFASDVSGRPALYLADLPR